MTEPIVHHLIVAALIRRNGEILLIQQQGVNDPAPYWALPGGVVESDESLTAAVVREVQEETGLRIREVGSPLYSIWVESGAGNRWSTTVFTVDQWQGELCYVDPDRLVSDGAWFQQAEARERLLALPYRSMREPLLAALQGKVPPGTVWFYRTGPENTPVRAQPAELASWQDPSYLVAGTPRQRAAHATLIQLDLSNVLCMHSPLLIGSLPLGLDTSASDLDIACWTPDPDVFVETVEARYGTFPQFSVQHVMKRGIPSVVIGFHAGDFALELFGQPEPLLAQYGVRHMLVEARLLALGGEGARHQIQKLKQDGVKTEPAFARYFAFSGDPYECLWALSFEDDETLCSALLQS